MHTVTKIFRDYPAAHRQPGHAGHCRFIHGHSWGFDITFGAKEKDANGFVIDVGKLGAVKDWLTMMFDHTLLLNETDPHLASLQDKLKGPTGSKMFADIRVVPNCGMEGLAEFVYAGVNRILFGLVEYPQGMELTDWRERKVRVQSVTCWEDSKNSATYSE